MHTPPPPSSSSTIVRFFKIITQTSLEDGKLRIPNGFTRKFGDNMSNPFSLKTPDGKEWSIHWTKNDEGIWFQKGWKEFATHYSLDHGHMVLFEYDKNTNHFEVHIFDGSTLEIEYNFHGSQSEQNNSNQISDDLVESLDEIPQCKKTRPKSPMPSPQPQKKLRTNTSENVVTSFKVQNLTAVDMWNLIPESMKTRSKSPLSTPQPHKKSKTRSKSPLSTPQPHKKSKTDKSEDGGRVKEDIAGTTACLKSEKERESFTSKVAEALHTAFKANCPTFTAIMLSTFVNQHLNVPSKFAKMYFERKQSSDILLQVSDGRTWPVEYHLGRIDVGWKTFASENNLKVGDVCIFELTKRKPLTLKVLIFHCGEKTHSPPPQESVQGDEVNLLDPEKLLEVKNEPIISEEVNRETRRISLEDQDSPLSNTNEALNEAEKFTSENPFFRIMVNAKLPIRKVNVPKHISNCFEKTQTVMLKVQEKTWPVKFLCYPNPAASNLSAGWSLFVQECKLQTGDVCVLELINKENAVFDVHIFRSKSIMTNTDGKETPTESLQTIRYSFTSEALKEAKKFTSDATDGKETPTMPLETSCDSFTDEALKEAEKFTSENPFFIVNIGPNQPSVPQHFRSTYFKNTQIVKFKVQEKMWPVKLLCYPYQRPNIFSAGWSLFVQECKLQTGDVCVFELINKEDPVLYVHIFRSKDGKETPTMPLQTSCDAFINEALREAKNFTSENPFFIVNIRPNRPGKKFMPKVPSAFTRIYMHNKTRIVKLQFDKKSWPVNCLCYKNQKGSLSSGWNIFAEENKVQAGDVCVFELIKKEDAVFDVHIFGGHS